MLSPFPFMQPLVLALLPPLMLAYRWLQRYYRATSRELRRLESVARSPVYTAFSGEAAVPAPARPAVLLCVYTWLSRQAHAPSTVSPPCSCPHPRAEALSGGPTIRAFGAQQHYQAAAEAAVAAQQRASVAGAAAGSWLALRLQLMAAALAAAVAVAAVAEHAGALPWLAGSDAAGRKSMAAGLVGLSLSYVLPITGLLSGLLAASAETGALAG